MMTRPVGWSMTARGAALALAIVAGPGLATAEGGPAVAGLFERLDLDGDGAVDRAELDRFRQARFLEADADRSGAITREEMRAAAERRAVRMARRIFARMDRDGDGLVARAEYDAVSAGRMSRVFERFDGNRDGRVTRAEIRDARR